MIEDGTFLDLSIDYQGQRVKITVHHWIHYEIIAKAAAKRGVSSSDLYREAFDAAGEASDEAVSRYVQGLSLSGEGDAKDVPKDNFLGL
jgi:hypothetical protein